LLFSNPNWCNFWRNILYRNISSNYCTVFKKKPYFHTAKPIVVFNIFKPMSKSIRTVIAGSNYKAINYIKSEVRKLSQLEVVAEYVNDKDIVNGIKANNFDLLISDVYLNSCTLFDVLPAAEKRAFEIIILASSEKFAVQAFRAGVLFYSIFPVDTNAMHLAINKLKLRIDIKLKNPTTDLILKKISENSFLIASSNNEEIIRHDEIIFIVENDGYCTLYFSNNQSLTVQCTIENINQCLDKTMFCRVNQSHIINLLFIKQLIKQLDYKIIAGGYEFQINETDYEMVYNKLQNLYAE